MTDTDIETQQPRSKRRRVATSIFLGLCALLGVLAVRFNPATPADQGATVSASADSFVSDGKCYQNIAFSGPREVPCGSLAPLPPAVRQCAAAVVIAGLSAYLTGNPVGAGMGTTAAGCGAVLF